MPIYSRELVTPPETEPIGKEEAKHNSNIDFTEDDGFIDALITTARTHVEAWTGRQIITATWKVYLDGWPACGEIILPFGRLQSVTSLIYTDRDGTAVTWTASGSDLQLSGVTKAHVDTKANQGRIVLPFSGSWPSALLRRVNPIEIQFACGYGGQADVPATIKQAMLLLVEQWYKNRDIAVVGKSVTMVELPLAAAALLLPLRISYF